MHSEGLNPLRIKMAISSVRLIVTMTTVAHVLWAMRHSTAALASSTVLGGGSVTAAWRISTGCGIPKTAVEVGYLVCTGKHGVILIHCYLVNSR